MGMSVVDRIGQVIKSLGRLVTSDNAPKANARKALADLNKLLDEHANNHMVRLYNTKRAELLAALNAAVVAHTPSAAIDVEDDLRVVVYVCMHNREVVSELETLAVKAGMAELVDYLKGLIATIEAQQAAA